MVNKEFFELLDLLEQEKKIPRQVFIDSLQNALTKAYKSQYDRPSAVELVLIPEKKLIKIIAYRTVVEEVTNKETEISLEDAKLINKKYKVGDRITEEIEPKNFGRIVIQNAKQTINQKLREEENRVAFEQLAEKEEELVTCVIKKIDGKNVYVDLMKMEALLGPQDQLPGDKYRVGDKIKVFVKKIKQGSTRGPQIQVSRTCADFVRRLFEMEVPEIKNGQIEIKGVVREPGYRTKIAVYSADGKIDPVGACVGSRGLRVNSIVAELGGEKIEIIHWNPDMLEYIARAMSPASVKAVVANEKDESATVYVAPDMLSLAIGREGQNARLAARLTGWKIDVKPFSEDVIEQAQIASEGEEEEAEPVETALEDTIDIFDDEDNNKATEDISMDDISLDDFDLPDEEKKED
ncbi:MAG: transcription termination/antitermination protein NusA [Clostridia bacterium]|nr:transcription termination/antitermination protein NusA [Clostridia bacterium]